MASSARSELEIEVLAFWNLSQRGWRLLRADIADPEIDEVRDDLQLILDMTDSPVLRETLARGMRRDDARQRHPAKKPVSA